MSIARVIASLRREERHLDEGKAFKWCNSPFCYAKTTLGGPYAIMPIIV